MPAIEKYATPRTAAEVALAIRLFALDQLGLTPSGSVDPDGRDIELDLPSGETVAILVTTADERDARGARP